MTVNVSKQTAYVVMLSPVLAVSKQTAYFVMLPDVGTVTATLEFGGEGSLTIDAGELILEAYPSIAFRGEMTLGLAAGRDPPFLCDAPSPKTWARADLASTAWACAAVIPAEECDEQDHTGNDILAYVSGDRFSYVNGDHLKFG